MSGVADWRSRTRLLFGDEGAGEFEKIYASSFFYDDEIAESIDDI